jgi:molecular chaperone IbpA
MNSSYSLAPLFRSTIGFDRINDLFETAICSDVASYPHTTSKSVAMMTIAS